MSTSSESQGISTLRGIRFAQLSLLSALMLSCNEPPEKPIPALNPELAAPKDKAPLQTPAAPAQPGSVTRIPLGDLYQLVQSNAALIYDVRPLIYYKMGHIPGAISWPKAKLAAGLTENEARIRTANAANTPVVIYCTDLACPDAISVANALEARGHRVSVLQGGYEAWKIANG